MYCFSGAIQSISLVCFMGTEIMGSCVVMVGEGCAGEAAAGRAFCRGMAARGGLGLAGVVIGDNGVGDNVGSGLSWASEDTLGR